MAYSSRNMATKMIAQVFKEVQLAQYLMFATSILAILDVPVVHVLLLFYLVDDVIHLHVASHRTFAVPHLAR